jgi:hypothetical protein
LLCNALIIDVFVASKVAFTFWAIAGLASKTIYLQHPTEVKAWVKKVEGQTLGFINKWWPAVVGLILLVLLVQRNPLYKNSLTIDFTANPEQVQEKAGSCVERKPQYQAQHQPCMVLFL